jgi:hypothetical protein
VGQEGITCGFWGARWTAVNSSVFSATSWRERKRIQMDIKHSAKKRRKHLVTRFFCFLTSGSFFLAVPYGLYEINACL